MDAVNVFYSHVLRSGLHTVQIYPAPGACLPKLTCSFVGEAPGSSSHRYLISPPLIRKTVYLFEHFSMRCYQRDSLILSAIVLLRSSRHRDVRNPIYELQIRCVKWTSVIFTCVISWLNPVFDHLLESFWRDDSNKWSNIGFGQEIGIIDMKIRTLSGALLNIRGIDGWNSGSLMHQVFFTGLMQ